MVWMYEQPLLLVYIIQPHACLVDHSLLCWQCSLNALCVYQPHFTIKWVLLLLPKYIINILQVWQQLLDESYCLLYHLTVNAAATATATISAVVLLTMTGLSSTALL
jgi:hypothetical protein